MPRRGFSCSRRSSTACIPARASVADWKRCETCRHFYNDCRRQRKEAYEERGETISKTVQLRKVKVEKATSPFALRTRSGSGPPIQKFLWKNF